MKASRQIVLVGLLMIGCTFGIGKPLHAQSLAQPPAPQSPHWPHINLFAYARSLFLANLSNDTYQWYVSHLDAVEVQGNGPAVRTLNPTSELFSYQFDLSTYTSAALVGVPEEAFLHFSESTVLTFYSLDRKQVVGTATVAGCPENTPLSSGCRVQTHLWNDRRYVFNPQSTAFRAWKAAKILGPLNGYGYATDTSRFIWIDEHAPGFSWPLSIGYQTIVQSGGGIREFAGRRPGNSSFESEYANAVTDWLSFLAIQAAQVSKKVLINANENALHPWLLGQANAIHGISTESKHRPDGFSGPAEYQQYLTLIKGLTTAGGLVDLHGIWCYTGPAEYSSGNYGSSAARYRMWRLASYYQFKEPAGSPGTVYFNPGFCSDETPTIDQSSKDQSEWLLAYQVDVGQPSGDTILYQQGTAGCSYQIFGRSFTKALVLVRPKDGPTCTDFSDASAATVTFTTPIQTLLENGTLSAPTTIVKIRNAEAVIAYQVGGVDTTPPSQPFGVTVR